jgi:hypothetical protein
MYFEYISNSIHQIVYRAMIPYMMVVIVALMKSIRVTYRSVAHWLTSRLEEERKVMAKPGIYDITRNSRIINSLHLDAIILVIDGIY